jgi:hypothetical protein
LTLNSEAPLVHSGKYHHQGSAPLSFGAMSPNVALLSKLSREANNSVRLDITLFKRKDTSLWFAKLEIHFSISIKPGMCTVLSDLAPFLFSVYHSRIWCAFSKGFFVYCTLITSKRTWEQRNIAKILCGSLNL